MGRMVVFVSAIALCAGSAAFAQQASTQAQQHPIEKYSVLARAAYQFEKLDLNHDGMVDQAEWNKSVDDYVAKYRAEMQKRFTDMDTTHAGKVTKEQFVAAREKWFDTVDTNHSGTIDQEKLREYRRKEQAAAQ